MTKPKAMNLEFEATLPNSWQLPHAAPAQIADSTNLEKIALHSDDIVDITSTFFKEENLNLRKHEICSSS